MDTWIDKMRVQSQSNTCGQMSVWKIYYLYVINFPVNSKWVLEYWLIFYVSRAFIWATTCYIFINISVLNLGWEYSAVKIRLRLRLRIRLKLWIRLRLRHISDSGQTLLMSDVRFQLVQEMSLDHFFIVAKIRTIWNA